jgi:hypothetical protein
MRIAFIPQLYLKYAPKCQDCKNIKRVKYINKWFCPILSEIKNKTIEVSKDTIRCGAYFKDKTRSSKGSIF